MRPPTGGAERMMTWQPIYPNSFDPSQIVTPADGYAEVERTSIASRCYVCGHVVHAHYQEPGGSGGCVATGEPGYTLEQAVSGHRRKPFIGGGACLCPGWTRGQLPRALTKHLSLVTDDDDAGCGNCEHPLYNHSEEQGCHSCPCTVHDADIESA